MDHVLLQLSPICGPQVHPMHHVKGEPHVALHDLVPEPIIALDMGPEPIPLLHECVDLRYQLTASQFLFCVEITHEETHEMRRGHRAYPSV
jgi:hypothetical protein